MVMVTWKQFMQSNPYLAKQGESQFFQYGVGLAFLATIRKDGAPRVHPVCPVISNGGLYILITPQSPKKWDLLRDGRYSLQAFPQDRPDSDEFYLSGYAELIENLRLFESVFDDAKHMANREEVLFELLIERAMHTIWEGFGTPEFGPVHNKWSAGA
jgi:hypothetical protein